MEALRLQARNYWRATTQFSAHSHRGVRIPSRCGCRRRRRIAADSQKMEHGTKASDFKEMKDAIIVMQHQRQEDEAPRARHGPEGGGLAPLHGGRQAADVPQGRVRAPRGGCRRRSSRSCAARCASSCRSRTRRRPSSSATARRARCSARPRCSRRASPPPRSRRTPRVVCLEGAFLEQLFRPPGAARPLLLLPRRVRGRAALPAHPVGRRVKQPTVTASTSVRLSLRRGDGQQGVLRHLP